MGAVDFAMRLKKVDGGGLELRCVKNRFGPDDWSTPLRLEVTDTSARFVDLTGEREAEKQAEREEKMGVLQEVIATLEREKGRAPNQTEVLSTAPRMNLGEKVVADLLARGAGRYWKVAGLRPKTYSAIAQFIYRGAELRNSKPGPGNGSSESPQEPEAQPELEEFEV
jgi:hypothetical protein